MCSTPVLWQPQTRRFCALHKHLMLEGLYENVYNSNVICTIKYFVEDRNGPRWGHRSSQDLDRYAGCRRGAGVAWTCLFPEGRAPAQWIGRFCHGGGEPARRPLMLEEVVPERLCREGSRIRRSDRPGGSSIVDTSGICSNTGSSESKLSVKKGYEGF